MDKPKPKSSIAEKELDRLQGQFEKYDTQVKELTKDQMDTAPKQETEMQVKMSNREIQSKIPNAIYLKPIKSIGSGQKFNESFRDMYEFDKQYVPFIAENSEVKGEAIDVWTRPYGGMPAEEWLVPVNIPVFGPRYLAEKLRRSSYHRLKSEQKTQSHTDGFGTWEGALVVDETVQRLDARPVSNRKSIFMAANDF